MKPTLASFTSLAVLLFAGWQAVATLSRAPAFAPSLRVETARGTTILGDPEAMYDRAEYYDVIANGWYGRTLVAALNGADPSNPDQEMTNAFARAGELASESLRHNPGDPGSWMLYTRTEAALGRPRAAMDAYQTWYAVAPDSMIHSSSRLHFLASFLEDTDARDIALSEIDPEMVQSDLTMMYLSGTYRNAAKIISERPEFAVFGAVLPENEG